MQLAWASHIGYIGTRMYLGLSVSCQDSHACRFLGGFDYYTEDTVWTRRADAFRVFTMFRVILPRDLLLETFL